VTKPENQDTTRATATFIRSRRLTTAMVLSVGAGTLLYGTVLAFPATASEASASPTATACATSTASISPSATASGTGTGTDTGTATATASGSASSTDTATATATDSATAGPTASGSGSGSPSASASETASASASATASATDCATHTATATATATASASATKSHTATASASASPKKSATATIAGKGSPTQPVAPAANDVASIPVFADTPTGEYFAYTDVPPGNAAYQLPHGTITRAQIIARAKLWVQEQVPYSQTEWWTNADGTYRQDCSGMVSMEWDLNQNTDFWTGNLNLVSHTIAAAELLPGDILLSDVHTILFAGWANAQHTEFDYYEEAHPGTVARYVVDAPLAAFLDNGFAPFRYDGVVGSTTLPANPANGDLYSTLAQGASEIEPPGVSDVQPLGLGQSASSASPTASKTHLSAQVAADDVVSPEGGRSEGIALGVGGAFLLGAGLLLRRPIPLRGGYRRKH